MVSRYDFKLLLLNIIDSRFNLGYCCYNKIWCFSIIVSRFNWIRIIGVLVK